MDDKPIEDALELRGVAFVVDRCEEGVQKKWRTNAWAIVSLVLIVLVVIGIGLLIGRIYPVTTKGLQQAAWTPPSAVFAVVWPVLYALIAISIWLLATQCTATPSQKAAQITALVLVAAQLALNYAWTPAYQGGRNPKAAMYVLLATLALTIPAIPVSVASGSWGSAAALGPYVAWLIFALILNHNQIAVSLA